MNNQEIDGTITGRWVIQLWRGDCLVSEDHVDTLCVTEGSPGVTSYERPECVLVHRNFEFRRAGFSE